MDPIIALSARSTPKGTLDRPSTALSARRRTTPVGRRVPILLVRAAPTFGSVPDQRPPMDDRGRDGDGDRRHRAERKEQAEAHQAQVGGSADDAVRDTFVVDRWVLWSGRRCRGQASGQRSDTLGR
jgi:hypothetical protein